MISKFMNKIIEFRLFVIIIFMVIGVLSLYCIDKSNVDAIADIGENQQIIFTKWEGHSPKDIEDQITYPLSTALQGIPGIDRVRGSSAFGISTIYLIFKEDVEYYWSRSRVLEKLATSFGNLPEGVKPVMGPDATGLGQVLWYTLDNDKDSVEPLALHKLRSIQDFHIKLLLQSIEGVSEVSSIGGFIKEYQVDIDPLQLLALNIHFSDIINAIKNSNFDVGAEIIEVGGAEGIVRGLGFFKNISDIEEVVLKEVDNIPVRIKDIGTVQIGPSFRRGALDRNGLETVGGIVTMRYRENPREVIARIKDKLPQIRSGLPKGTSLNIYYDRTELVDNTLSTVYSALTQAIIVTLITITLFLLHVKSSLLVGLTLPFGVGISFILMYFLNIDFNIMSLSGMIIAIGSMVDMGIIMTENIYSHISISKPLSFEERINTIKRATLEITPAIITSVLTTVVTFIPVFALSGVEGKLFVPLAYAKTLAMLGSVFVSITLIPVLSIYLFNKELKPIDKNKVGVGITKIYRRALDWVLTHRKVFLMFPALLLILGGISFSFLNEEFMPPLNEGDILYMPVTGSDVSFTEASDLLRYTDKEILKHPLVLNVIGKMGRSDSALDPAPISMFETIIKLKPQQQWPRGKSVYDIMDELDESLQIPGLVNSWNFPIQTRVAMISTGIKSPVAIKVYGKDLIVLESIAKKISKEVKNIDGARGVFTDEVNDKTYFEFEIDRVAASRFGLNTGDINSVVKSAVGGMSIGHMYEGRERYPIRVRYKKDFRDQLRLLKNILIPTALGQNIPISQVAKINISKGPAVIQSENGMLRTTVELSVAGRDISDFIAEVKKIIKNKVYIPEGYSIEWAGEYEKIEKSNKKIMILIPISLLLNILILYSNFKSLKLSAIIFSAVPVAACGGVILLGLTSTSSSIAVWIGFIALFGIAVDDGVVMMTFLSEGIKENKVYDYPQLKSIIIEAGCRRIRPLVMTTFTTLFSLLPIFLATKQGSEVMKSMAIPTLGGMTIELITLFMVPVIFSYMHERKLNY